VDRGLVKRNNLMFDQAQQMNQLGLAQGAPAQAGRANR
jgi:hypothetical protein